MAYFCGACHCPLPGPVGACPRCGARLVGIRKFFVDPLTQLSFAMISALLVGTICLMFVGIALAARSHGSAILYVLGTALAWFGVAVGFRFRRRANAEFKKKKRKRIAQTGVTWVGGAAAVSMLLGVLAFGQIGDFPQRETADAGQRPPAPTPPLQQPDPPIPLPEAPPPRRVFHHLFDGKDVSRWQFDKDPKQFWQVRDGVLVCNGAIPLGREPLFTRDEYTDYILRFEFSLESKTQTVIAPRVDATLPPWWILLRDEPIPDLDEFGRLADLGRVSGAILVPVERTPHLNGEGIAVAPLYTYNPTQKPDIKAGAWHTAELRVEGLRVSLQLNGQRRMDNDLGKLSRQPPRTSCLPESLLVSKGRLGLRNQTGSVAFRNMVLEPLTVSTP